MELNKKLLITKVLFFLSIILSAISFTNERFLGIKEIYPFYYWKLYTQPLGNNYTSDDYKIYAITKNNDTIRIRNIGYSSFNKDDYNYFLRNEATKIKTKTHPLSYCKKRIKDFGHFVAPDYPEYLLVKETFNPMEIIKDSTNYQKEIILSTR